PRRGCIPQPGVAQRTPGTDAPGVAQRTPGTDSFVSRAERHQLAAIGVEQHAVPFRDGVARDEVALVGVESERRYPIPFEVLVGRPEAPVVEVPDEEDRLRAGREAARPLLGTARHTIDVPELEQVAR